MDLFVTTLTGTTFELRVNPFETIISIKAKLQQLEGIPISQQHIVWKNEELEDDFCLHDYNIRNGARLKLVLAMRGGPINMRKVSYEDPSMKEMAEFMDSNRDDVWNQLMNDDKQVTLLVFRDGEQLNFFRVFDRGDGTLSPCTNPLSSSSVYDSIEDENNNEDKQLENKITRDKMNILRQKIETTKKNKHIPKPPPSQRPINMTSSHRKLSRPTLPTMPIGQTVGMETPRSVKQLASRSAQKIESFTRVKLPPVKVKGRLEPLDDCSSSVSSTSPISCRSSSSNLRTTVRLPNINEISTKEVPKKQSHRRRHMLKPLGRVHKQEAGEFFSELQSPPYEDQPSPVYTDLTGIMRDPVEYDNYTKLMKWVKHQPEKENLSPRKKSPVSKKSGVRLHSPKVHVHGNLSHLPPVVNKRNVPKKNKVRCSICTKKLGLASTYQCRCGGTFCTVHRYPETHTCNYDYKNEGRKLLQKSNPVVMAPKLPKI